MAGRMGVRRDSPWRTIGLARLANERPGARSYAVGRIPQGVDIAMRTGGGHSRRMRVRRGRVVLALRGYGLERGREG